MSEQTGRLAIVEQLRGLAALSVCWFHLTNQYRDWVGASGEYGWLGVEAFFVISGFVIPLSFARDWSRLGRNAISGFLLRRIVRIEPPYVLSVLLVVLLNFAASRNPFFNGPAFDLSLPQIVFHAAYLIPLTNYPWLQPVYWTLAYEFLFYITVAVGIGLFKCKASLLLGLGYFAFVAALGLGLMTPLFGLFGMGLLVFRARTGLDRVGWTVFAIGVTGAAMMVEGFVAQAIIGLLTACVICVNGWSQGIPNLAGRILNGLGKISFSLYLLHVPIGGKIVNLGMRWLNSPEGHLCLSLAALCGSLLAAAIFWQFVERPCLNMAATIANRQQQASFHRNGS